jgi:hypothetical protein
VDTPRRPERRRDQDLRRGEPERRASHGRAATAERTARLAAGYVEAMTGKEPEGVVSLEQTGDGGWLVDVEVVETHRIPDSTDILAVYETELDADGELIAYRRVKRYSRCQVGEK